MSIDHPTDRPWFVAPMLCSPGEPFDSDDYLFEVKWDGIRCLALVESDGHRLVSRRRLEMTDRFPELCCLQALPPGTVLDGELVVLRAGKPDLGAVQSRFQLSSPLKIAAAVRTAPATYIVFDQLYHRRRSLLSLPLELRRQRLAETLESVGPSRLVFSRGIVGRGVRYFESVCQQGLEGVVAKRIGSRYAPGKRSGSWIKIKPAPSARSENRRRRRSP